MQLNCPAKINLFLEVTGKRPDGYHRLATLFAKINLYDVLDFTATTSGKIELEVESGGGIPPISAGPDNLVVRAARAFFRAFKIGRGVRIRLTKRIPAGAGLGGGSSDAAGTLLGLAKLLDIKIDAKKKAMLKRLGARLGADVPFFLQPAAFCIGTGIGDRLKPLVIPHSLPYMILVYPGVQVSTAESYRNLPARDPADVLTRLSHLDKLVRNLKKGRPIEEWQSLLFNRLEQARLPVLSHVERARKVLAQLGASGVRMSGSGSSVFGFISSHQDGEKCLKRLQGYPWNVFLTSCHG
ncbi:MAG: 4-(cytidine 5'-diphospho)-2-C-methyl-D-erythritol kinase [Elusimicrobia bacterium RIFCSPHIGHO2_02_FULL_57_9]|nr:MAG: 4-(cytidine 5'-diphospho)-2-C-methyl-D-erythritol kinase [Elusimicrobia bacterium RIFCSPHIGHO2_02_FULL_57_9]